MITNADILRMRNDFGMVFTSALTIRRPALVDNDFGGYTQGTPTDVAVMGTVAPLPIDAFSRSEHEIAEQYQGQALWHIQMPPGTDVRVSDQILWGSRTFEVRAVKGPRSIEIALVVICLENV